MSTLAANSVLQGMAVGIVWVPLTVTTFATLDTRHTPEAMALFHLLRNIGSSFFISICVAEIVRSTGENYSRMTEMVSPYNKALSLPWVMGGWSMDFAAGTGAAGEGDQPAGGDDRLCECVRALHGDIGGGDRGGGVREEAATGRGGGGVRD